MQYIQELLIHQHHLQIYKTNILELIALPIFLIFLKLNFNELKSNNLELMQYSRSIFRDSILH